MANRTFLSPIQTLQCNPVRLYCKFLVVNDGACTLASSPYNEGITSATFSGTGVLTIVLQDAYAGLAGVSAITDFNGAADYTHIAVNAATNVLAKSVVLGVYDYDSTKAPTNNNNMYITLDLLNYSA